MDLLCCENTAVERRAYADPAVLGDDRVLQNLLKTEERYAPSSSYFECVQRDISPLMRKIVAEWMLEVSDCFRSTCRPWIFQNFTINRTLSSLVRSRLDTLRCFLRVSTKLPTRSMVFCGKSSMEKSKEAWNARLDFFDSRKGSRVIYASYIAIISIGFNEIRFTLSRRMVGFDNSLSYSTSVQWKRKRIIRNYISVIVVILYGPPVNTRVT